MGGNAAMVHHKYIDTLMTDNGKEFAKLFRVEGCSVRDAFDYGNSPSVQVDGLRCLRWV